MDPQPAETEPRIPDYELIRKIGSGGFGEVWIARAVTGAFRAVKIVHRRPGDEASFLREFSGIRRFTEFALGKPGLLALLHVGRDEAAGILYYVMELADDAVQGPNIDPATYVPGTLREHLQRRGALPVAEVVQLGVDLAQALVNLHAAGLVHRDVKPSNVILVGGVPKLADVGLVTEQGERRTYVGTPGYVPPEGPGLPTADIYALGKLLYELATGNPARDFPRLPGKLPADREGRQQFAALNSILLKASAPEARRRYANAREMLDELLLVRAQRAVSLFKLRARRSRRVVVLSLAVAVVALVVAQVAVRQTRRFFEEAYGAKLNQANMVLAQTNLPLARMLLDTQTNRSYDARGFEWYALRHDAEGDAVDWVRDKQTNIQTLLFTPQNDRLVGLLSLEDKPYVRVWNATNGELVSTTPHAGKLVWVDRGGGIRSMPRGDPSLAPGNAAGTVAPENLPTVLCSEGISWAIRSIRPTDRVGYFAAGPSPDRAWRPGEIAIPGWKATEFPYLCAASAESNPRLCFALMSGRNHNAKVRLASVSSDGTGSWGPIALEDPAYVLAMSRDGSRLAMVTGSPRNNLEMLDARTGAVSWRVGRHSGLIQAVVFSPDGALLATGASDGMIIVGRSADGEVLRRISGMAGEVKTIAWSEDGTKIAATGILGDLRVWSWATAPPAREAAGLLVNNGGGMVFSADGTRIAASNPGDSVSVFETRDLAKVALAAGVFNPVAFLGPDQLVGLDRSGRLVSHDLLRHTNVLVGPNLREGLPPDAEISAAAYLPVAASGSVVVTGTEGTERIWKLGESHPAWELSVPGPSNSTGHESNPGSISVASEAGVAICVHRWGDVRVLEPSPRYLKWSWKLPDRPWRSSVFLSSDASWCLIADDDGNLRRFRARDGKPLASERNGAHFTRLAVGGLGGRIVAGTTKGEIQVFGLDPIRAMTSLYATSDRSYSGEISVEDLRFSPDQQWLAARTSAGTLRVWDLRMDRRW